MRILDYFKKREKNEKVLSVTKNNTQLSNKTKKKKINNLADFIENALIENGGNYDDILKKLLSISKFSKEKHIADCNLKRVDETLKDFFMYQKDIKFYPIKDMPYSAFYTKKDGWNFYNYRGVTVMQDDKTKKPMLYYGRRNENAETHQKDTIFYFDDDMVILKDEWLASYEEIPLFGDGIYAEFTFDKDIHITKLAFRYVEDARLGFWSDERVYEFKTTRQKSTTQKLEENINNLNQNTKNKEKWHIF